MARRSAAFMPVIAPQPGPAAQNNAPALPRKTERQGRGDDYSGKPGTSVLTPSRQRPGKGSQALPAAAGRQKSVGSAV